MKRITASGVRGVIWDKIKNRWVTYLWIDGKNKYIGSFHNMEDAIQAKIKVVEEYGKPELLEPYKYISVNERSKIYYNKDKEKKLKKMRERHDKNREGDLLRNMGYKRRLKLKIIEEYGGKCVCCGENRFEFLTIDHINGDGKQHRKELGANMLYNWLKKNNFPKDNFQLLCMNCNFAKGHFGKCPHEIEREKENLNE